MPANKPPFDGEWVRLKGRVEYVRGVTYKAAVDLHEELDRGSYILLRANNIQDGRLSFDDVQYVDKSKVKPKQLLRKGDILICASSGSKSLVGKAALVENDMPITFGAFCCVLRPKTGESECLGHYFQSRQYRKAIERACSGSNINNLKAASFESLIVPLYSKTDMLSVVGVLDALVAQKRGTESQLELLDTLVKSRFVEMFGDPTVEHDGWPYETIGNVCQVITGNTPSRKDEANYGDSIEWCKTDNITDARYLTRAAESLSEAGAQRGRIAPAGSVLMACIAGSIKTIGKVAINDRPVAFNQQINALIPMDGLGVDYLLWALRLSKDYLCSDVNMQLKGILNKSALSAKRFAIPPLALQQEFADFVAEVDKSRFIVQQKIEKLQTLYDSLAQKYFG